MTFNSPELVVRRPSVCPSVHFSHVYNYLFTGSINFNQTWHRASLGEGVSSLLDHSISTERYNNETSKKLSLTNFNWNLKIFFSRTNCQFQLKLIWHKQRRVQRRRTGRSIAPFLKFSRVNFIFEKFDCITRIHFIVTNKQRLQNCISFDLYSHYKSTGYVWRGIKSISRPQKSYRAGTAPPPPVKKFLDPPMTKHHWIKGIQLLDN